MSYALGMLSDPYACKWERHYQRAELFLARGGFDSIRQEQGCVAACKKRGVESSLALHLAAANRAQSSPEIRLAPRMSRSRYSDSHEAEWDDVLRWLDAPDVSSEHQAARERPVPEISQWLLSEDAYLDWLRPSSRTRHLFVCGPVDGDKTGLCSTIIESIPLQDAAQDSDLIYFYCSYSDEALQTYEGLLRSLISQLTKSTQDDRFAELRLACTRKKSSSAYLEPILVSFLKNGKPTYLVIDDLDKVQDIDDFTDGLQRLSGCENLKLLVTGTERTLRCKELLDMSALNISDLAARFRKASSSATGSQIPLRLRKFESQAPTITHWSPAAVQALDSALASSNLEEIVTLLEQQFESLATGSRAWLHELMDLGYNEQEIGEVLLEERNDSPWIYFEPWAHGRGWPSANFHITNCVHQALSSEEVVADPGTIYPVPDAHDLRRTVASLCGLAGIVPSDRSRGLLNSKVSFPDISTACVFLCEESRGIREALRVLKDAVNGFLKAVQYLQEADGMCNEFTILCKEHNRDKLIQMQSIRVKDCMKFYERVSDLYDGFRDDDDGLSRKVDHIIDRILGFWSDTFLSGHGFHAGWSSDSNISMSWHRIQACALTAQVLCLGLVSYCQAHIAPLRAFFLEFDLSRIVLRGARTSDAQVLVESGRLTCMDDMLQSPLLVFSALESYEVSDSSSGQSARADLIANSDQLMDTWGPGTATQRLQPTGNRMITSIRLRGGTIHPVDDRGLDFHWTKHEHVEPRHHDTEWRSYARMSIGARLNVNVRCTLTDQQSLAKFHGHANALGTRASYYRQSQKEIGSQFGQYGILTFNVAFVKDEGLTQKAKSLHGLQQRSDYLSFLESPCGLQVSVCSGLAQRVSTRLLLAELLPVHVKRKIREPALWSKLHDDYFLLNVLISGDLERFSRWLGRNDPECLEVFLRLAEEVMSTLEKTGLQPNGDTFSVAFVPNSPREQIRSIDFDSRNSNYWTRALRDTDACATFAYFTLACLQVGGLGCRQKERSWHGEIMLLQTEVHRHFHRADLTPTPTPWSLEHGQLYRLGRPDADVSHALCAKVLRPSRSEDPRLLVQPLTVPATTLRRLLSKQPRHQHLRERMNLSDQVLRAFMISTDKTSFQFT